jgi:hypothetical protein
MHCYIDGEVSESITRTKFETPYSDVSSAYNRHFIDITLSLPLLSFWLCICSLFFFIHVCIIFIPNICPQKNWLLNANFCYISYISIVHNNWWPSCKLNDQMFSFQVFHPSYSWTQFDGMKLNNLMGDECREKCTTFEIFLSMLVLFSIA